MKKILFVFLIVLLSSACYGNAKITIQTTLPVYVDLAGSASLAAYATLAGTASSAATANYAALSAVATTAGYATLTGTASSCSGYTVLSGTSSVCSGASLYSTLSGTATIAGYSSIAGTATNAAYATLTGTASNCSGYAVLSGTSSLCSGTSSYASNLSMVYGSPVIRTMLNNSGLNRTTGEVVILDTSVATGCAFTTTTTTNDAKVFGVLLTASATGENAQVCVGGYAGDVLKVNGTTDIAVGDPLSTYPAAGIAAKGSYGTGAIFAIALEAYTTDDSSGVIKAWIQ